MEARLLSPLLQLFLFRVFVSTVKPHTSHAFCVLALRCRRMLGGETPTAVADGVLQPKALASPLEEVAGSEAKLAEPHSTSEAPATKRKAIELFRQVRAGLKKTGRAGAAWHTPAFTQAYERQHALKFGVGFTLTASSKVQASWNLFCLDPNLIVAAACSCPGPPLFKSCTCLGPRSC